MQRDEFICKSCFDSDSTLNVHHRYYEKNKEPWEYDDDVLVTLCESCHEKTTQEIRVIQQMIGWDDKREGAKFLLECMNDHCLQGFSKSCIMFMRFALRDYEEVDPDVVKFMMSPSELRDNFIALIGPIIDAAQRNWDAQLAELKEPSNEN